MAPSDDALDSGSSASQETGSCPTRLPQSKCDASSMFAATELKVADGVRCLSIVRAFSLPGGVVDDGIGGIRRRRPHGVLRVDSVVLVLPAPKSDTCRWRRTAALALWFPYDLQHWRFTSSD